MMTAFIKNSPILGTVFISFEFSLDKRDIPVLIKHNLKTFHEQVFESDFYSLLLHLDYECITDS